MSEDISQSHPEGAPLAKTQDEILVERQLGTPDKTEKAFATPSADAVLELGEAVARRIVTVDQGKTALRRESRGSMPPRGNSGVSSPDDNLHRDPTVSRRSSDGSTPPRGNSGVSSPNYKPDSAPNASRRNSTGSMPPRGGSGVSSPRR